MCYLFLHRHCWLVDRQLGIRPVKCWLLVCWWTQFDRSFARLIAPVVITTSAILSSSKIQWMEMTFWWRTYPGCAGKWPLNECSVICRKWLELHCSIAAGSTLTWSIASQLSLLTSAGRKISSVVEGEYLMRLTSMMVWLPAALHIQLSIHTHTRHFNSHFPGEPGLAGFPLNSPSPFIPELHIIWDRPKLSTIMRWWWVTDPIVHWVNFVVRTIRSCVLPLIDSVSVSPVVWPSDREHLYYYYYYYTAR